VRRLNRCQAVPEAGDLPGEPFELLEMYCGEGLEARCASIGEAHSDDSVIVWVARSKDESCALGAIDETDDAVVAQEEVVGHFADRGAPLVLVASDGEKELVLGRGEACDPRLLLAPSLEAPQAGPQCQEPDVGVGCQLHSNSDSIVLRWIVQLLPLWELWELPDLSDLWATPGPSSDLTWVMPTLVDPAVNPTRRIIR